MRTVKEKQSFLKAFDLYDGKIDGKAGKKTKAGIKAYQKAKGYLKVDGKWGKKTETAADEDEAMLKNLKSGYVSTHFKKSEFKCGCNGRYCNGYNGKDVNRHLLLILEAIREKYDKPITISSGIRCQRYNDNLRGSIPTSVHRLGGAADIYIPGVTDTKKGRNKVQKLAYKLGAAYCYHGTSNMGNAVHINV